MKKKNAKGYSVKAFSVIERKHFSTLTINTRFVLLVQDQVTVYKDESGRSGTLERETERQREREREKHRHKKKNRKQKLPQRETETRRDRKINMDLFTNVIVGVLVCVFVFCYSS